MIENNIDITHALQALQAIEIRTAREIDGVMDDIPEDVPTINNHVIEKFKNQSSLILKNSKPEKYKILPLIGSAGSGKTHILTNLYKITAMNNGVFIPIDISLLNETFPLINSYLFQAITRSTPKNPSQLSKIIKNIVIALKFVKLPNNMEIFLGDLTTDQLLAMTDKVVKKLDVATKSKNFPFKDVAKALFLLSSNKWDVASVGRNILESSEISDEDKTRFGLLYNVHPPKHVFWGLMWLFKLNNSFTTLAFDQLDALVRDPATNTGDNAAHTTNDDIAEYNKITKNFFDDLSWILKTPSKIFIVMNMFAETWNKLNTSDYYHSIISDNFYEGITLNAVNNQNQIENMIFNILNPVYQRFKVKPPYRTWPFPKAFFEATEGLYAREILKKVDEYIRTCRSKGKIIDWPGTDVDPNGIEKIDDLFKKIMEGKISDKFKHQNEEISFWRAALISFMECFAYENDLAFKGLSFEPKYLSTVNPKKMTADVKIHLTKDGVPQKSLSVWAILRTNANSFRSVLLSAIRSSGINKNLSNRKLAVIRFIDTPSGKVTQQKWEEFLDLGGIEIRPQNDCIKLLFAINTIRAKYPKKFPLWARKRSPTKGAGRLREVMHDLFGV